MLSQRRREPVSSSSTASQSDTLTLRPARPDEDLPAILALGRRALGWVGGEADGRLFRWKHLENPFGQSPMWLALDGQQVVGLRTFLRWQFRDRDGAMLSAVRAVDTATDPEYQGRGIFTRLTLDAIDELRAEGVNLVFNTPNQSSLPGYLKMGWSVVGRLSTAAMLTRPGSLRTIATARTSADRWSIEIRVGEPAPDVFADYEAIKALLSIPARSGRVATARTPEFLAWRYGFNPLRYRVLLHGSSPAEGLAVFRLRRRGSAIEAVVCDVLTPRANRRVERALLRSVAQLTGADYLIRLQRAPVTYGPFVRLPGISPILVCRPLRRFRIPAQRNWDLGMGDVELF